MNVRISLDRVLMNSPWKVHYLEAIVRADETARRLSDHLLVGRRRSFSEKKQWILRRTMVVCS